MRDASHATVSVQRDDGVVMVQVADDGRGGADPAKGSGLRGLADRVSALNGRREVTPEPGQGTTIKATMTRCCCGKASRGSSRTLVLTWSVRPTMRTS
jgi:glucose-6-phosphate-specific signal transduction histidine kinase